MEKVECVYCNHNVTAPKSEDESPPVIDDDAAWAKIAKDHAPTCEWVLTRAHRTKEQSKQATLRWIRTDYSDVASEILTLVRLTDDAIDRTFVSVDLDGKSYPFLVEICSGPNVGDDFIGLYDLDGKKLDIGNAKWEAVTEADLEVIELIENSWETGGSKVERLGA